MTYWIVKSGVCMNEICRVAGYVKLAKLWERSSETARAYHRSHYTNKYAQDARYQLVDVYIDITGQKKIRNRPEMLRLIHDCMRGEIDCIAAQTRGYLAANMQEFCYLIKFLFDLNRNIQIMTEDVEFHINTAVNQDHQREALIQMANSYIKLKPADYALWRSDIEKAIYGETSKSLKDGTRT